MTDELTRIPSDFQTELDKRVFYLQTLYDVSRELMGNVELAAILKNFLLMTLGNFGVAEGFVQLHDVHARQPLRMVSIGISEDDRSFLAERVSECLTEQAVGKVHLQDDPLGCFEFLGPSVSCTLVFPVDESCTGMLVLGSKLTEEAFSEEDKNLLETMVNTLVIAIKNARYTEALKAAYTEVATLNKAKDKVIHHLSHELKTPLALLQVSLKLLKKQLVSVPEENWQKTMQRAERNLKRLLDMQSEVEDIMQNPSNVGCRLMGHLLDMCSDQLQALAAEQSGEGPVVECIKNRIEALFGTGPAAPETISLGQFVSDELALMRKNFSHRSLDLVAHVEPTAMITMPTDPLRKMVSGLVKNAVENTPDGGRIIVGTTRKDHTAVLTVKDSGIGIVAAHRQRIFEGFFPTQDTLNYSSKKPFDFNAGGKGADLLRMKIFSERFNFRLDMVSTRCGFIPNTDDICPGDIRQCPHINRPEDCFQSGGTTFTVTFPIHETDAASG